MEFVEFKIKPIQKRAFESEFMSILKESNIQCNQWEFHYGDNYTIAEIPKYAVDQMTVEQVEMLKSFQ